MRGDNHLLALTTTVDEITGEVKPLFAFPVQVCKATETASSGWANACPSGAPTEGVVRVDPETGETFTAADVRKGVRIAGEFREIDKADIEQIDEATKVKTMVAEGRIDLSEAWAKYGSRVEATYYLQSPPKGGSPKAYRLTYEALLPEKKAKGKVATPAQAIVTKRTARSRQALGFIYADPDQQALRMVKLAFNAQMRDADEQVKAPMLADVNEVQIAMARKVIGQMPDGAEVIETAVDDAVVMREELVEKALAGAPVAAPAKAVKEKVEEDNLEAALAASLASLAAV